MIWNNPEDSIIKLEVFVKFTAMRERKRATDRHTDTQTHRHTERDRERERELADPDNSKIAVMLYLFPAPAPALHLPSPRFIPSYPLSWDLQQSPFLTVSAGANLKMAVTWCLFVCVTMGQLVNEEKFPSTKPIYLWSYTAKQ